MQKILILILFGTFCIHSVAQNTADFKRDSGNISLKDYVFEIEKRSNYRFYYKNEWIDSIKVKKTVNVKDVPSGLENLLGNTNLNYYVKKDSSVIIYKGDVIVTDFNPKKVEFKEHALLSVDGEQVVHTKDKYIEGRKTIFLETVDVGNPKEKDTGKTYTISGRVYIESTGEPIIGATILIKELQKGTVSDNDGHFIISLKKGKYLVEVNFLSMKKRTFYLQVHSSGSIEVPMEKELVSLSEVKVVAERNNNVKGMQMGFEQLSAKSIKVLPAVMGEKDVLKVAQLLPGVQSAGEGSSGVIVRGGSADQNLFYVNKLPVYNTSHLFGFFGAFNPDIINNFTLYKSNIPAQYGGRISSVFDITTRQGNKKSFFGKGGISPVTGHLLVEGPIRKEKSSFVLSYRGTYSDWILSRMNNVNLKNSRARFNDFSAVYNSQINAKNLLKGFFYTSYDQFSLAQTDDHNYSNIGGTLAWKSQLSSVLNADFTLIGSNYNFNHTNKKNPSEAYNQEYNLAHYELKSDFMLLVDDRHRLTFGTNSIFYNLDRGEILPFGKESTRQVINLGTERAIENAIYISDELALLPKLSAQLGLRYSMYGILGYGDVNIYGHDKPKNKHSITSVKSFESNEIAKWYGNFEPRLAFNYVLNNNNSVKLSYNRMAQYMFMLSNTVALSPTDQWKLSDYHIAPPVSDQISIGYYQDFNLKGIQTSIELYRKWTNNVVDYNDGVEFISAEPTEFLLLQGNQDSYGLEFMLKKNTGKLNGWFSYTYSKSSMLVNNEVTGEKINYGQSYPSNYDKPHSINLVTNYKSSRRINFSSVLVYSTGRPITYPVAVYYSGDNQVLHYSSRNEYRIPDYFRVDLSLTYEGNLRYEKWLHSTWSFNIYNLLGRKNAYSVYFEAEQDKIQAYKLSIFGQPIFTISWNFKFGNYASE